MFKQSIQNEPNSWDKFKDRFSSAVLWKSDKSIVGTPMTAMTRTSKRTFTKASEVRAERFNRLRSSGFKEPEKLELRNVSGALRFRKRDSIMELSARFFQQLNRDSPDYPTFGKAFKEYCKSTFMHGLKYYGDEKLTYLERYSWLLFPLVGFIVSLFVIFHVWIEWDENPVITSVSDTNYPTSSLLFPAVSICTVNKAVAEKLIIQGCRFNFTLTQMKLIISNTIDPSGTNNDNEESESVFGVDGKTSLKYLRLVAPKCDDYLLSCRYNGIPIEKCSHAFSPMLTDTGYCCIFNYLESNFVRKDKEFDKEVEEQEMEYEYLQQAVWNYYDAHKREKESKGWVDKNANLTDNFCARHYEDELFPKICRYINKCRKKPQDCGLVMKEHMPEPTKKISDEFPLNAVGAGRGRGLTVMTDTLRCDSVPTGSFKGLRVLVHHPEEFPGVGERGFVIGPGMENNIAISPFDVFTDDGVKSFEPEDRGCYFTEEFPLQYYKIYSRSSCIIECENEFIYRECDCVPFYSPGNYTICGKHKFLDCVKKAIDMIQKRDFSLRSHTPHDSKKRFKFKSREEMQQDRSCAQFCMPSCHETRYSVGITSAPFPNQMEPNQTKLLREAIAAERTMLSNINYVSGSVSVMQIFFKENSLMQFVRTEFYSGIDFLSNLGSVLRLMLGFSFLSLVEFVYFMTLKLYLDRKKNRFENALFISPGDPNGEIEISIFRVIFEICQDECKRMKEFIVIKFTQMMNK